MTFGKNKDDILLIVTLKDGEKFAFLSEQGFKINKDLQNKKKKMGMFNLSKKEFKLKNKNYDTLDFVEHYKDNLKEYVYIGFQNNNSKNSFCIKISSSIIANESDPNFIFFNTSDYYKIDFKISQIELYQFTN